MRRSITARWGARTMTANATEGAPADRDRLSAIEQLRRGATRLADAPDLSKADVKLLSGIVAAIDKLERNFNGSIPPATSLPRPRGRNGGAKERLSEADQKRLLSMYGAGEKVSKVCQEFGVTRGTVYRYLHKHGVIAEAV